MHNSKPFRFNAVVESMSGSNQTGLATRSSSPSSPCSSGSGRGRLLVVPPCEPSSWSGLRCLGRRRNLELVGTGCSPEQVARRNWLLAGTGLLFRFHFVFCLFNFSFTFVFSISFVFLFCFVFKFFFTEG